MGHAAFSNFCRRMYLSKSFNCCESSDCSSNASGETERLSDRKAEQATPSGRLALMEIQTF